MLAYYYQTAGRYVWKSMCTEGTGSKCAARRKTTRQDLQTKRLQCGCVQFQTHMTLKSLKQHVSS